MSENKGSAPTCLRGGFHKQFRKCRKRPYPANGAKKRGVNGPLHKSLRLPAINQSEANAWIKNLAACANAAS